MPAHIFLRAGEFARASESEQASVTASDRFNTGEALSWRGGPVGTSEFPAKPSGLGFAFDAGNTYHSVEYLHYEASSSCLHTAHLPDIRIQSWLSLPVMPKSIRVTYHSFVVFHQVLQGCDTARARSLVDRMAVAAHQALTSASRKSAAVSSIRSPRADDPRSSIGFIAKSGGSSSDGASRGPHGTFRTRALRHESMPYFSSGGTPDTDEEGPWYHSATFLAWLYRMQVRQAVLYARTSGYMNPLSLYPPL